MKIQEKQINILLIDTSDLLNINFADEAVSIELEILLIGLSGGTATTSDFGETVWGGTSEAHTWYESVDGGLSDTINFVNWEIGVGESGGYSDTEVNSLFDGAADGGDSGTLTWTNNLESSDAPEENWSYWTP